jgi:GTP cyclohydrolase I
MTNVASQPDNVIEMAGSAAGMTANLTARWFEPPTREITAFQWERFEASIAEIFTAFGMDLASPGTRDTPKRFLKALYDITAGYDGDPKLATSFPAERGEVTEAAPSQVIEGPIEFNCLCEHHALPFFGTAVIGYIAGDQIIGISKLTRLVRLFARRFTVQERLGEQIADGLTALIEPRGVAVHLEAAHLCTHVRGVAEHSRTTTTVWRGEFADADLRREFLAEVRALRRDR